jgi:hypothetical protein
MAAHWPDAHDARVTEVAGSGTRDDLMTELREEGLGPLRLRRGAQVRQ